MFIILMVEKNRYVNGQYFKLYVTYMMLKCEINVKFKH